MVVLFVLFFLKTLKIKENRSQQNDKYFSLEIYVRRKWSTGSTIGKKCPGDHEFKGLRLCSFHEHRRAQKSTA